MAADTVLVVEDDQSLIDAMELILTEADVRVLKAMNGREALTALENAGTGSGKPKLILLDMKMPVMDGWEFAKEFYARYGRMVPIVVITAAENAQKRAEEIQADGFISKPFQIDDFLAKVSKFVQLKPF